MRMRTAILSLLVLALAAGAGAYLFLSTGPSSPGLQGDGVTLVDDGPDSGTLPGLNPDSRDAAGDGQREAVNPGAEESGDAQSVSADELASLDSNTLLGQVVDVEGNGIGGCLVQFLKDGVPARLAGAESRLVGVVGGTTETDEEGHFRLEALPAGNHHALRVHHPEIALKFVTGVMVHTYGESLEPPIVLAYGKRLRGTVTNEFGLPLEGVQLHLDGDWLPSNPRPSHDRLSAVSDMDGNYEILGIPDGKRALTAVAESMGQVTRIQSLHFMDRTGQAHIVNIEMRSQAKLKGRVIDLAGSGIGGVELLALDRKAYRDVGNSRAVSAPDGSFSFSKLPPGKYHVSSRSPLYAPAAMLDVQTPIEDLNLVLTRLPAIRGRVVNGDTGAGLPDFVLQLMFHQLGPNHPATPMGNPLSVQGASDGNFVFPVRPLGGEFSLLATASGFAATASETFAITPGQAGAEVVVSMTRGGDIRGRVVTEDGEPLVGARIICRDNSWTDDPMSQMLGMEEGRIGTELSVRSNKDGQFRLANLRPASYQVTVSAARFHQSTQRDLLVAEGEELLMGEVSLSVGGGLHGVLLDAESTPVMGGVVFLNPVAGTSAMPVRRCKSGLEGRWKVGDVVPGAYLLTGKPPQAEDMGVFGMWPSPGGEQIMIEGGIDDQRIVHLDQWTVPKPPAPKPPTGNVSGSVLSAAGTGRVGVAIGLKSAGPEGAVDRDGKSGREGAFTFVAVPPGEYDLFITAEPATTVRVSVSADLWTNQDLQSGE
ncbi:MAG: hypothetical protein ACI9F9_000273 [Candidatus Paceibacteria bacterium]|jgi:hypothetical protein